MVTVEEAEQIIMSKTRDLGNELVYFQDATGRILAEDITCDRDMPPYNRITMDGIAVKYDAIAEGIRSFNITQMQAAGNAPATIHHNNECIEIMTGAPLPVNADTIIPYENISISDGIAKITNDTIKKSQYIHTCGSDIKKGEVVVLQGRFIDPAVINIAATMGKHELCVKKLPKVIVISTGNELVDIADTPSPYQIRRSNSYTTKAVLKQYGIHADLLHLNDDPYQIHHYLKNCLDQYDAIILSGGVSMGKFDHIPEQLLALNVEQLFHKVRQRPGKPFWFGAHPGGALVFAFPGNPVSTFMCLHRYFIPWLLASSGITNQQKWFAMLDSDFTFNTPLQYFLQVRLYMNENGQLLATPDMGNGSGDLANLADNDAFMELPLQQNEFKKGETYRIWAYKNVWLK